MNSSRKPQSGRAPASGRAGSRPAGGRDRAEGAGGRGPGRQPDSGADRRETGGRGPGRQPDRGAAYGDSRRGQGRPSGDRPRDTGFRKADTGRGPRPSGSGSRDGRGSRQYDDVIVICGIHPIEEFLRARPGAIRCIVLDRRTPPGAIEIAREAASKGISIREADPAEFEEMVGNANAQGIAAELRGLDSVDGDELIDRVAAQGDGILVVLDLVQDPQNLGSILRTAAFFGVAGIIIPKDRSVRLTPSAVRASAGGAARVPVGEVTNLARTLQKCASMGMSVAGTVVEGGLPLDRLPKTGMRVIVLGSEGTGMRRLVRESCSMNVTIPSPGGFESLNVGVTAGIMLHASVPASLTGAPASAGERGEDEA